MTLLNKRTVSETKTSPILVLDFMNKAGTNFQGICEEITESMETKQLAKNA
jgi:hypothetical protein